MKYRKRPIPVEAVRWCGDNLPEVKLLAGNDVCLARSPSRPGVRVLQVRTLHGWADCREGDWVVKGAVDCWPVDAGEFERNYEEIPEEAEPEGVRVNREAIEEEERRGAAEWRPEVDRLTGDDL